MHRVTSYLLFDATCKPAMEFYHSIFGGELALTTVGDSPMANAFPTALYQRVVHARLKNDDIDIPASDWLAHEEEPIRGNMNCLYINNCPLDETKRIFEKLSENGEVTDPFDLKPFGWYGRLIDQYGVIWMFHSEDSL